MQEINHKSKNNRKEFWQKITNISITLYLFVPFLTHVASPSSSFCFTKMEDIGTVSGQRLVKKYVGKDSKDSDTGNCYFI